MHCLPQVILSLALCVILSTPQALAEKHRESSNYRLGLRQSVGRGENVYAEGRFTSAIMNKINALKGVSSTTTTSPPDYEYTSFFVPNVEYPDSSTTSLTALPSSTSGAESTVPTGAGTGTGLSSSLAGRSFNDPENDDDDDQLYNARAYADDDGDDEEEEVSSQGGNDNDDDDEAEDDYYMIAGGAMPVAAAAAVSPPVGGGLATPVRRPTEKQWQQFQLEQRNRRRVNRLQREHNQVVRELLRRQRISQRRNTQRLHRIQLRNQRNNMLRNRRYRNRNRTQQQRRRRNQLARRRRIAAQRQRRRQQLNQRRRLRQMMRRRRP